MTQGEVYIQSVTTIFDVSSSLWNWLLEPICTVFDMTVCMKWMIKCDLMRLGSWLLCRFSPVRLARWFVMQIVEVLRTFRVTTNN